ncbi:hypothetical protein [Kitasatospora sp. NPDC093558]|uniref:hypothetical protein n=1 Tax=Kitasatospora sp. NPDC093558 TaxID=3155201 RepID=UPI0034291B84
MSTSLSSALAPGPDIGPSALGVLGVFLGLVSIGTFIAWVVVEQRSPDTAKHDHSFLAWISLGALLVATPVFVYLGVRRSRNKRVMAGRPVAEKLWSQGMYCRRCGTVHLRAGQAGHSGQGRVLSLREFRTMVWEAGGYGQLVDRQAV